MVFAQTIEYLREREPRKEGREKGREEGREEARQEQIEAALRLARAKIPGFADEPRVRHGTALVELIVALGTADGPDHARAALDRLAPQSPDQ
jgi:hypothetical protein